MVSPSTPPADVFLADGEVVAGRSRRRGVVTTPRPGASLTGAGLDAIALARANVYVFDALGGDLDEVGSGGAVTVVVGSGPTTICVFEMCGRGGLAVGSNGNIYVVASEEHYQIFRGSRRPAPSPAWWAPTRSSTTWTPWPSIRDGNFYVADENDTIEKVTPEGVVTRLAGSPGVAGSADGIGSAARFTVPVGVAVDGAGNVYVADACRIRKIVQ